jgi:hypothetical protein
MTKESETPAALPRRALGLSAVLLLISIATAIGLISAGVFDPKPAGPLCSEHVLESEQLAPESNRTLWLHEPQLVGRDTVRLTAAHAGGDADVAYGLVLGEPQHYLAAAVSPLGYVALWEQTGSEVRDVMPWQTWPHVKLGGAPNEIQVDVVQGRVTVRVNREQLWQGSWQPPGGQTGLYAHSFGGASAIDFRQLQHYCSPLR